MSVARVTWYFDFISPYAYLLSARLDALAKDVEIDCVPVLFAGLLNHWGQKGPAEVPPKKVFIFRQCIWRAREDGIDFHTPAKHPFNPLRALRLAIALGNDRATVQKIFRSIWVDGNLPDDDVGWATMQETLGVDDGDALTADADVKAQLFRNGEAAVAAGVFGVPTCRVGKELFWGDDCLEMVCDFIAHPEMLDDDDMQRINTLVPSAERR
jgi:2-hydroxychromene-2-carboxylate isomerase